jgi:type II secretion system protein C
MVATKNIIQSKLDAASPKLQEWFKKLGADGLKRIERNVTVVLVIVGTAYLGATISSALVMSALMGQILGTRTKSTVTAADAAATMPARTVTNLRDVHKVIRERNLFNSEGKFPEEKLGTREGAAKGVFDINAPCRATTLPIELLGTIYLGNSTQSIATVKDKAYSEADVYRAGDEIIGSEGALVAAVERQTLIINNQGVKECLELNKPLPGQASDGFPSVGGSDFGDFQVGGGGGGSEVVLESSYVENELGPGFAKIMDAARFVPNTIDNNTNGFKVFSIKAGSLLTRIGLQNNDVITQVNDTSLKNPDQGFAFYQALQDEKEIRLQVLRGGTTPVMVTVRVK